VCYRSEDADPAKSYRHPTSSAPHALQSRKPALKCVLNRRLDITAVALYPFGHVAQVKTVNDAGPGIQTRTDFGITLSFKIETPHAVKAFIVSTGSVVIRKCQNVHLSRDNVPPLNPP